VKLITGIIHPSRLDVVKSALQAFDVHGLTVGPVSGHSWQQGRIEIYRGVSYPVDLLPRTRLELLAADDEALDLVRVIAAAAGTGSGGDGKIWVTSVEEVIPAPAEKWTANVL
jgi:nitrogen regulatory protein P-II 1